MQTGWTGEGPDGAPAMPVTELLLAQHERGPGDTLETALARSRGADARQARDEAGAIRDPDEVAASMVSRGYRPGHVSDLGQRLADKSAELAAEREKIAKGERVNARVRGMLERGQIGGLEAARMMDGDFGDAHRAEQLQRQCANLQRQIGDASAMIAPAAQRAPEPLDAVNRTANEFFRATTRERFAAAQAGKPQRARRPKELSRSRGDATRSEDCTWCSAFGVPDEQSFLAHNDPERPVPVTPPGTVPQAEVDRQVRAEQERPEHAGRRRYDGYAEITR